MKVRPVGMLAMAIGVAALGMPVLSGGCDREVSHQETVHKNPDGTGSKTETTVKEKPDGTVQKDTSKTVDKTPNNP